MSQSAAIAISVAISIGFAIDFIVHLLIPDTGRRMGAWMGFALLTIILATVQMLDTKADLTDRAFYGIAGGAALVALVVLPIAGRRSRRVEEWPEPSGRPNATLARQQARRNF